MKPVRCIPDRGSVAIQGVSVTVNRAYALTSVAGDDRYWRVDRMLGMAWAKEKGLVVEPESGITVTREHSQDDFVVHDQSRRQLTETGEKLVREIFEFTYEHCSWPRPFQLRYLQTYFYEQQERAAMRKFVRERIRMLATILPSEQELCCVLNADVDIIPAPPLVSSETWMEYVRKQEAEERRSRMEVAR